MMAEPLTFMAVHAHPDDECLGTGGAFARYREEGIHTVLVTATRGEEGEVVAPDMNPEEVLPKLGDVRLEELRRALVSSSMGSTRNYICWATVIRAWPIRRRMRSSRLFCPS